MTGARAVSTAGAKTVEVRLFRYSGGGSATAYGNVTASYYPFGGTGTNVLSLGPSSPGP